MREIHREQVVVEARALVWIGGRLFDVAAGRRSVSFDGSPPSQRFGPYGAQFDAATISPRGDVIALMASTGTKALLFTPDGELIRELNRSYYQAQSYRYPLALFTLPDGRTGLAHCPEEYNRLEIEVAATGERLTAADRDTTDVFHSRLAVSRSGRYLLSAGWVWHPWDCVAVYDLHRALADATTLDSWHGTFDMPREVGAEVSGACFIGDDVVLNTSPEEYDPQSPEELEPNTVARWSTATETFTWRRRLDRTAGDLVPIGGDFLALYEHPRLFDGSTGELLAEWPDLPTGTAASSIVPGESFSGPARIAVDEAGSRFAVTDGTKVTVVHLG
ncbi:MULTISPECIES: hypothetical protein [Saccharothrix]|uniref:hypothetical protein n=1 Tax=Saccharothrix TaxID=2071 RepID=UPI00093C64E0|nr:hypothetical protein [Saccharothrix sp. CB00851]